MEGKQMRIFIGHIALASLVIMVAGCGSATRTESAKSSESTKKTEKAADAKAEAKTCAMQAGGHDVLRLTVPADTVCKPQEGFVVVNSDHRTVEFWLVKDAKTIDGAVGKVS